MKTDEEARDQFETSSIYPPPRDYGGQTFKIRNYDMTIPPTDSENNHPWLKICFKTEPKKYIETLLDYCFEGMPEANFVVQRNHKKNWYHAPWMHYHVGGREPIHGLTFERPTPPKEFSATQNSWLQTWACAYYNTLGASVFQRVWADPANPDWSKDEKFEEGSVVFKVLVTDATDAELPFMKGSPVWKAVTAQQANEDEPPNPEHRNTTLSTLRLLQVDVATRDERADTGWIFGTYMYDGRGTSTQSSGIDPQTTQDPQWGIPDPGWRRLIPVGLMWGNDPALTQNDFANGSRPVEHWINPAVDILFQQLNPDRYWWGWNGRMNGPADDFISACSSCHSVAQRIPRNEDPEVDEFKIIIPPFPSRDEKGQFIPENDEETMKWFRNLKDQRFNEDNVSGDYSLQLMMGYNNYQRWREGKEPGKFSLRLGRQAGT